MEDDTTTTVKTENSEASQKKRLRPLTSMYYKPVKEGFLVKRGKIKRCIVPLNL